MNDQEKSNNLQGQNSESEQTDHGEGHLISASARFSGPIPPPQILEGYENILPGSADRIMTMAEKQLEHRQHLEGSVVKSNIQNERTGMLLAFILTSLFMIFGAYLILNDKETAGYFAVFGPVIFHAGNYIYNKKREEKSSQENQQED